MKKILEHVLRKEMKKKNRMLSRIFRKETLPVMLSLVLMTGSTTSAAAAAEEAYDPVPDYIHLPVVEENSQTPSGLCTTWSCVYFGSYPFAEVADEAWDAVDDYALQEGDLIRDDDLFARLEAAEWDNDTAVLDGNEYIRVGRDSAPAGGEIREQHYKWAEDRPWHYFQIQPIRWRVLDIQEDKALLVCDRMPDSVPFHTADEAVTWSESILRSWLNGLGAEMNKQQTDFAGSGFIDRAFTAEERDAIVPVVCENLSNQDYGTDSGPDTEDSLFILSNAEVFEGSDAGRYGFHPGRDYDDPAKRFTSTLYAKSMGAWWSPVDAYKGNSFWFMRTSGYTPQSVTYICDFGYIYSKGTLVTCDDAGVVPAMWIDLEEADLLDAGERKSTDIMHFAETLEEAFPIPEIDDPVVTADETMPGGMNTVWNAVTFGHYPQTEIVMEAPAESLSGMEGDIEADPELFQRLQAALAETSGTSEEAGGLVLLDDMQYLCLDGRWFRCDPITWRVLEVSDGTALLLSDRSLDSVPYHAEYRDVFWEDCDLRGWLNGSVSFDEDTAYGGRSFLEMAFTEQERQAIIVSDVPNASNYYFDTACGSGTQDRVFILSEEEVFCSEKAERYGFRPSDAIPDPGRRMTPTAYALARGVWTSESDETAGIGFWLLRTNGYTQDNVVYVGEKGYLYNRGIPVTCMDAGIVPALRVRLGAAPITCVQDIGDTERISVSFE